MQSEKEIYLFVLIRLASYISLNIAYNAYKGPGSHFLQSPVTVLLLIYHCKVSTFKYIELYMR